jgi:CubicO group peptidase (beta-lactamase class C family)
MNKCTILRIGDAHEAGFLAERLAIISQRARSWVDEGLTQAVCYLLARRGVIAVEEAAGKLSYLPGSTPVALDSIFNMASLSKPVTATAIMLLVEDGLLSLSRPLISYIPELRGAGSETVFVHHLLTHTSGFRASDAIRLLEETDDSSLQGRTSGVERELDRLVNAYCGFVPADIPGQVHNYCGANYVFLGEIIRRLTGMSLQDFAKERIFRPLEMDSTSFGLPPTRYARYVHPDPAIFASYYDHPLNDPQRLEVPHPGNGLFSTVRDMAVFGQLFLNGGVYAGMRLLSRASVSAMTTNQIPGVGGFVNRRRRWLPEVWWGYGWMVRRPNDGNRWTYSHGVLPPPGTFFHEGASGAGMWVDPANDVIGVFLSVRSIDTATGERRWEYDHFENMATAAIAN